MAIASPCTLFDEVIEFLASTPTATELLAFEPSETLKSRFQVLLEQNRHDSLSPDERTELDEFLRMNHLVNMIKIRTRQRLAAE